MLAAKLQRSLNEVLRQCHKAHKVKDDPIERAVHEIESWLGDQVPATAPKDRAYRAASKFVAGESLDENDMDFIAAAITVPVKEHGGKRAIDSSRFSRELLSVVYYNEVVEESFWSLSWLWLMQSYFQMDTCSLDQAKHTRENFRHLQRFLGRSHHLFTVKNPLGWAKALANNLEVISDQPCKKYAKAVFSGNHAVVDTLKEKLGIPPHSWFWVQLTHDIVISVTDEANDDIFKKQLSYLIPYLREHKHHNDKSIQAILERYYQCADKSRDKDLCDFVISDGGWGTPKLRDTSITSKWKSISEPVWLMVRNWVNAENLRIFIKELAARNGKDADKGRFEFWVQYTDQMNIKFAFGNKTVNQVATNDVIRKLLREEKETSARLSGAASSDALIMQIGKYTVVEFSTHGTAAFIYLSHDLPFDFYSRMLSDDTSGRGLRAARERTKSQHITLNLNSFKQYSNGDCIIRHNTKGDDLYPWHDHVRQGLMHLGIYPDK